MKKVRLATGVYRDTFGIEARVQVGREIRSTRFPHDASLEKMRAWQQDTRDDLRSVAPLAELPAEARGTLEEDIGRYLARIEGRPSFKADRSHLRAWLPLVGHKSRRHITTEDVELAIAGWRKASKPNAVRRIRVTAYARDTQTIKTYDRKTPIGSGQAVATRTIRHRCRLLADLYHALDGKKKPTPVDDANVPKVVKTVPMGVDVQVVRAVALKLAKAGHPQTYARYLVLASTGQRPAQLMRAIPGDWDLEAGVWVVRSAKGAPAHTITLNRDMVAALRSFEAAKAWGAYDETQHARRVHAAGWPMSIRPYNARHAVMIDALAAGVELGDVQGLAGHTSPDTTRRFYGPLAIERQRKVSNKLNGRLKGIFGPRKVAGGTAISTTRNTTRRS